MSAPTLWEEGRSPGRLVACLAVIGCALVSMVDLALLGRLSPLFDVGFVLVCVAGVLLVRPRDFFVTGVMPPFLMLAVLAVLAVVRPGAIAGSDDGFGQAVVAGLAHHSGALFAADALVLVVIGIRVRIASIRRDRELRRSSPYSVRADYSNRDGSPAPTRVTSGAPEEKSTTVVGSEVVSPASTTASSF